MMNRGAIPRRLRRFLVLHPAPQGGIGDTPRLAAGRFIECSNDFELLTITYDQSAASPRSPTAKKPGRPRNKGLPGFSVPVYST
jgi:hypothetical protein